MKNERIPEGENERQFHNPYTVLVHTIGSESEARPKESANVGMHNVYTGCAEILHLSSRKSLLRIL